MRPLHMLTMLFGIASLTSGACSNERDSEAPPDARAQTGAQAPLAGWILSGPAQASYSLSLDRDVFVSGGASGRLEHVGGTAEGAGIVMQSIPADAYRNRRVRFSASVRTLGVAGWAGLYMKVERPEARDPFDNMQDRPLGGTREWERHEVVLDVPEDARSIQFGLVQDGAGISWIDDAKLEVVGDDVPTTDLDRRPAAPVDADLEAAPDAGAWTLTGVAKDDYRMERSTEAKHGGRSSLVLKSAAVTPRGYAAVEQGFRADAWRKKRVRFSAWLRGEAVDREGGLSVMVLGPDAPPMSPGLAAAGNGRSGTFDWERYDVVLDVPAEADTIVVGIGMSSTGALFFDDLAVEEVGLDVPVSNIDMRPSEIVNPSLDEVDAAEASRPKGWFVSGGARLHYRGVIDTKVKNEGRSSVRFEPAVEEPQGYGTLMQRFKAHDYRGKRMRLTAYTKGKGVDRRGDLWLRVQARESPGDGAGLGGAACQLSGDYDWKPCVMVFDVPQRGDAIDVGVGTTGHGTIWLDGIKLEEVGLDVPVTTGKTPPRSLLNGSFDLDPEAPKGWFLSGAGYADFVVSVDGGAAKLQAKGSATPGGYGTVMQSVQATDYIGKRLRMKARVRGDGIDSGDLWVRVQSAVSPGDGPGLGGGACALSGDFDWQPCEVVFDVPERASSIQIGAGLRGSGRGTLRLDDVVLEEVDTRVDITGVTRDGSGPENLGFD
ncbi:MAG: hypothetical protein HOV80_15705 [Polyangiaceae bacterium]|nr:hypothetical protein [Polyangiaceae bacterium]